jgi:hypothetical protein
MFGSFSKLPGGNVHPCRFVKLQSDNTVVECGAGEDMWGISQPHTRNLALSGWDDGYAGVSGDPAINIFGPGDDEAPLELGGTVTAGQRIKSGAAGVGVAATSDKDKAGAVALRGGVSGEIIPVKPMRLDLGV